MFNRDKGEADLDDEFEDVSFDDDFGGGDYIAPIRDEDGTKKSRHTFKSSKDADVFDNLDMRTSVMISLMMGYSVMKDTNPFWMIMLKSLKLNLNHLKRNPNLSKEN